VVMALGKAFGKCRRSNKICLSCNWVVGGRCGVDGCACDVEVIRSV
jgi:hypothetical protein